MFFLRSVLPCVSDAGCHIQVTDLSHWGWSCGPGKPDFPGIRQDPARQSISEQKMLMYGAYGACHLSETLQIHMIHILTLTRTYWWNWRNPDSPGSAATSSILTPRPRQELFIVSLFSMAFCLDAPYPIESQRNSFSLSCNSLELQSSLIFVDHVDLHCVNFEAITSHSVP